MAPLSTREKRGKKRKHVEFTVRGYTILGPDTGLKRQKQSPVLDKLDQATKEHDVAFANPNITTEEADEKFPKDTQGTGFLGGLARIAIKAKLALGLDDYLEATVTVTS